MENLKPEIQSNLQFERRGVQRLYTRSRHSIERIDLEEIERLDLSVCPACQTPISYPTVQNRDVVGGKHFDYNIYSCYWCGWWNIFKFRVRSRTDEIYWAEQMRPRSERFASLNEFNYYEEHPEIRFLTRFLAIENEKIREISWTAFQDLTKEYLLDQGLDVADISRIRSSGGDFLCIDTNGNLIVAEAKHLTKQPVDIGVVWKVVGVITSEGLDGGMIITSHKFSSDAIMLMERGSIGRFTNREERKQVKYVEREALIQWLQEVQAREHKDMLSTIDAALNDDVMMEM